MAVSPRRDRKLTLIGKLSDGSTYAASRGYQVTKIVQEIASGMNDTRPKLLKLLTDPQIGKIVVEHRDRLTRFGFIYIEQFFAILTGPLIKRKMTLSIFATR